MTARASNSMFYPLTMCVTNCFYDYDYYYFWDVVRADNLWISVLHGRIAGTRKRARPRRRWKDEIKDWTELSVAECVRTAQDRTAWRAKVSLALAFDPQNEEESVQSLVVLLHYSRIHQQTNRQLISSLKRYG